MQRRRAWSPTSHRSARSSLASTCPQGVELSHITAVGGADTGLADAARSLDADLVVVGTHGHGGFRWLLLGSVAEKTVRLAPCSVMVARGAAGAGEGGYRNIIVGTDFSPAGQRAVARAVSLSAPGARIEVVHAWQVPADLSPEGSMMVGLAELRESLIADLAHTGAELLAAWRDCGRRIELTQVEGRPADILCERADAVHADLIVVGSHGRRGLRRLLMGSVAEATVRHAPCSVLISR